MNIVIKNWGKKTREKFFQKNTRIGYPKNVEKKIVSKKCEKKFFKKHMNIVTKNGGKKREKNFTRIIRISRTKNDRKNRLEKVRKHVFL